jgi:hypothetical protein
VERHGVPALEEQLVDEIGGTPLSRISLSGADFIALGTDAGRQQIAILLGELDRSIADLTVAQAYDPSGSIVFQEGLFRVAGADPVRLLSQWVASQQAAERNRLVVSNVTVAGRDLTRLLDPTRELGRNSYAFADGDTLWIIRADDMALLEEALGEVG